MTENVGHLIRRKEKAMKTNIIIVVAALFVNIVSIICFTKVKNHELKSVYKTLPILINISSAFLILIQGIKQSSLDLIYDKLPILLIILALGSLSYFIMDSKMKNENVVEAAENPIYQNNKRDTRKEYYKKHKKKR